LVAFQPLADAFRKMLWRLVGAQKFWADTFCYRSRPRSNERNQKNVLVEKSLYEQKNRISEEERRILEIRR
jgi:hypothetical protein